jgi:hypothetical protein
VCALLLGNSQDGCKDLLQGEVNKHQQPGHYTVILMSLLETSNSLLQEQHLTFSAIMYNSTAVSIVQYKGGGAR